MYKITDSHNKELNKQQIDELFKELNKELRKKMRNQPKRFKADMYVVGGACVVASLQSRQSTTDVDAMWNIGSEMKDCINIVGDNNNLGHTWCNCDFKTTKSYTNAIVYNSYVYKEYDRLVVRMVNLDLLLAMKLMSFRTDRKSDLADIKSIISRLRSNGMDAGKEYMQSLILKYYDNFDGLTLEAKGFLGMED